ncbi:MAG: TIGR03982 family His-Xaa-Ser system protein [Verrucomicrobiae bacterium]|nr:TIGR03982 family His-Xaa-Ser system protein [Verrucomicrobiae bacterium]
MAVGIAVAWLAMPLWRLAVMNIHQEEYGLLVQQCDGAMRDHYQARREAELRVEPDSQAIVQSAEMGLLICQDYDLYQKRLTQWGLRENELAQMRLRAIEARAGDLEEVIEIHEIRY